MIEEDMFLQGFMHVGKINKESILSKSDEEISSTMQSVVLGGGFITNAVHTKWIDGAENGDIEKVQDALDLVRTQLFLQNIEIQERLNPDIPSIKGDYNQLQQVFLNLFNNAGQAMPQGGVLTVETNHIDKEDKVSIQISDTGEGIKKEDLPYIFDPFFTTRSHMGGTGLGLSVSQGIIESHQGEIFCKSNHVEEKEEGSSGTTFTVILPVKSSIK